MVGAIIGGVVGGVLLCVLVACLLRRRQNQHESRGSSGITEVLPEVNPRASDQFPAHSAIVPSTTGDTAYANLMMVIPQRPPQRDAYEFGQISVRDDNNGYANPRLH